MRHLLLVNEPSLIDRVRTKSSQLISVISPNGDTSEALTSTLGINWLRLEERFSWYGNHVSFDAQTAPMINATPETPEVVHGPFSEDFRVVDLDAWPHGPIALSEAQAAVFRVLFYAKRALRTEEVMRKAGLASEKPGNVFNIKSKNKGDPRYEGPALAFRGIVSVNKIIGSYLINNRGKQNDCLY